MTVDTPSIALGLLLVTCCPAGALSNYLTGVARGSVATSVSMTAISTLFGIAVTPLLFAFWAAMNPDAKAVLQKIDIDPKQVIMMLLIMLVVPVTTGMLIRAKRPETADKIRLWSRRIAGVVFAVVVAILLLGNVKVLGTYAKTALPPVLLTFAIAVALGWGLARASGLGAADRRAVTLEVAFQNVALAIGIAVVFFPALAGVSCRPTRMPRSTHQPRLGVADVKLRDGRLPFRRRSSRLRARAPRSQRPSRQVSLREESAPRQGTRSYARLE
jgi:bile acid:Na+ symporter, BASS family